MTDIQVSLDDIEATTHRALIAHGAAEWIAASVATAVRVAEANNNKICGLYYLESYCTQLVSGRVNGQIEPVVTKPRLASVVVDAGFGFAQAAFQRGLPQAIDTVRETGTCSLSICHAHTCTSLGFFTEQIAKAGYVGIGFTNASAVVSPPGGMQAVIGTNPIAMSIPARDGGIAFQFDQSTSAVALGKITMAKSAGETIPPGWAVDAKGQSTTDPSEALTGSLVSLGGMETGYKGFGFGLMAEVLAAAITGSVNSVDVKGLKVAEGAPHDLGQFYFLLDPTGVSGDAFWARLARLSEVVEAQEGTRLPGSKPRSVSTVAISREVWEQVQTLANATP